MGWVGELEPCHTADIFISLSISLSLSVSLSLSLSLSLPLSLWGLIVGQVAGSCRQVLLSACCQGVVNHTARGHANERRASKEGGREGARKREKKEIGKHKREIMSKEREK